MAIDPTNTRLLAGEEVGLLDRVLAFSLRHRAWVFLSLVVWVGLGLWALTRLPIDAVPDVTNVQVQILTDAPGLSPLDVERFISAPVELAMGGLPHTEEIRSLSRFGLSVVTVVFEEGTDLYFARQLVGERLAEAREAIPPGFGEPEMGPISTGLGEIFQFEVRGGGHSLMDLRDILEWQVAPRLRAVPGVVEVNAMGGELRTFEVEVDPQRLAAHGVSLGEVFSALEANNGAAGGGYLTRGREQLVVRGVALVDDLDDLRRVVVRATDEGTPLTLGQLGRVAFAPMIRQGAVTRDGQGEVVIGIAMMLYGENPRVVAAALEAAVAEIGPTLPPGVSLDVFYDRTDLVDRSLRTVGANLLEGGILVVAVLLLTLGDLRGGLLVALAIPLSMAFAVMGMGLAGISGNLMSLGAIDFGLVVDGSVVMVEHVVYRVGRARARGEGLDDAGILGALREVARPVAFSVGIIILVYVPILALTGIEGKMFRPMAATVIFALVGSLVVALGVVPALAATLLRGAEARTTWFIRAAHRLYGPLLRRALDRPHRVGLGAAALFAGSLCLLPLMGAEFVPRLDEGSVALQIIRPPSVSLEEALTQATQVEATLVRAFPDEVETVVSRTGRAEIATDPMGVDFSDVYVMLTPPSAWTRADHQAALVEQMQAVLEAAVPGVSFAFSQPIELRTNELIEGVRSDVAVFIEGDDLDTLEGLGDRVAEVLRGVPGAQDVKAERVAGAPLLVIEVDREAISRLGLRASDVLDVVAAVGGRPVGTVLVGEKRHTLQVRLPAEVRASPESLGRVLVGSTGGARVPLSQVARLSVEEGPAQVGRAQGQRRLTVELNVRGRDVASFVAEARGALGRAIPLPAGYRLGWGGQFENLEAASGRLALLVPLALLLIFGLLQANFRSARVTLLVYTNVPLAVTGGLVALYARGLPLSISAAVGFIALFGVAVMNGVVLVTHVRALHLAGVSAREAAEEGARDRLRPVLMTALVAALGFLPMALATSAGAEVQRPLATVVIGGLVTSTLLTLLVLPSLYARWAGAPPAASR